MKIEIGVTINSPIEKVWEFYTKPKQMVKWNHASDDWHTTKAENDLKVGGKFFSRMESKEGRRGFDFAGKYEDVKTNELIRYVMEDGRNVEVNFVQEDEKTKVIISFTAEDENHIEMQREGWQAILNNFKRYVEKKVKLNPKRKAIKGVICGVRI